MLLQLENQYHAKANISYETLTSNKNTLEASAETNVYSKTLAKHNRLHSRVCSLYKSKIYSKDFTGCANNPQMVAEKNKSEHTRILLMI